MTIRSTGGRVAAYAWFAFAVLNFADIFVGFTGDPDYSLTTAVIAFLLLFGCGIAYTVGLRPLIAGDDDGVTVRNPLRDVRVPWGAVRRIEGRNAVTVTFTGPDGVELEARAWVLQTSPRAQAKAEARAEKEARKNQGQNLDLRGRTPTTYAAQQLNELKDRRRPKARSGAPDKAAKAKAEAAAEKPARGTVRWSVPAVAALAVPLAVLIVLVIVGLVS
ncbi:PH domain-containing protein [Actinomadura madurae]|uniref:PH domain-containing protein n=1 Tax=Actinomadura madurae TaxID=1993 RepID=UPI00202638D8|nr:PH domain-containing protein [Actinomadura madurae]MCP9950655.1 PH domain-containing protein [Actinomadura madurae]MCP9967436.1 PH domain-containing protein [Actinomadura madurae]MCP9979891.1 PH domain-containing protein [Actinomadura madurae]MCQ0008583.1 PH domain-containing protein [Actinomadura madurae]MCQ0016098.1 PH domain-containing protein [Actinomadura madurae]